MYVSDRQWKYISNRQWRIQDFPGEGVPTPIWGAPTYYYRPQTKFAKVMFLHLSVSHSVHRWEGVCLSACWDTHTPSWADTYPGRHTPLCSACWEIQATSGLYASYCNAYLFRNFFCRKLHDNERIWTYRPSLDLPIVVVRLLVGMWWSSESPQGATPLHCWKCTAASFLPSFRNQATLPPVQACNPHEVCFFFSRPIRGLAVDAV